MGDSQKKSDFFNLLLKNKPEDIRDWLVSKGKSQKPTCPIAFIKHDDEEKNEP